jgi:hypothetical protein
MIIFSLATTQNREENLESIIPNILQQCDLIYVNLVGYKKNPEILKNKRIIINIFEQAGSEIRFFNYNNVPDDCYYFTIDDDILYPKDYTEVMINNMKLYNNENVCCVHGSNIDKSMEKDFYKKNREVYHFRKELKQNVNVMIPGVGTSCFYKKNMKLKISDYKTKNMSDTYTACFLAEQNVKRISVKRPENWLEPMQEFGSKIFGNNPHEEIDKMINKYKDKL